MAARAVTTNIIRRHLASKAAEVEVASTHFKALKEKQSKFQIPDGKPVFLKGGVFDKILFQITAAGCVVGLGVMTKLFWDLAVPKK